MANDEQAPKAEASRMRGLNAGPGDVRVQQAKLRILFAC